jgi:hypothetical protein
MAPIPESGADAQSIAKARDAMRQKMAELPTEEPPSGASPEAIAKARQAMYQTMQQLPPDTTAPGAYQASRSPQPEMGRQQFPPLQGPEMPISADKVQRLHALLDRYKADLITPEQYQAERAKILATP